jgi:hypothetical protein
VEALPTMHHLYIENPPERALEQIEAFGRQTALGAHARSVLRFCMAKAWDDGHVEVTTAGVAASTGLSIDVVRTGLSELVRRTLIEVYEIETGSLVVRPVLLASELGTQAGIGWWQRLELRDELS